MTDIPLNSFADIAYAVRSIKTNDEVKLLLAEFEKVFTDAVNFMFPHMLDVPEVCWNYSSFLSYHAQDICVYTRSSESPVLTFCSRYEMQHDTKFTSMARVKLAGVAFALHELFSTRELYVEHAKSNAAPVQVAFLGTKLLKSVRVSSECKLSFHRDLTSIEEIKDAIKPKS